MMHKAKRFKDDRNETLKECLKPELLSLQVSTPLNLERWITATTHLGSSAEAEWVVRRLHT